MRRRIFELARRMTPRVSHTERIALVLGTVGIERLALTGTLCRTHLDVYTPRRDYDRRMHAKLGKLHATIDECDILHRRVTPPDHPFWNRAKEMGFLVGAFWSDRAAYPLWHARIAETFSPPPGAGRDSMLCAHQHRTPDPTRRGR